MVRVVIDCLFYETKSGVEFQLCAIILSIFEVLLIDTDEVFHVAALNEVIRRGPAIGGD